MLIGNPGPNAACYWLVSHFTLGEGIPQPIGCLNALPNSLSASNYVVITPLYPTGVLNLDVLKTPTSTAPSGACNCAVATAISSGAINDQSNSTSSYTLNAYNVTSFNLELDNEVVGAGSTHLILRQNNIFVADLSTGGGGGSTNFDVNGAPVSNPTTINFEDSTTTTGLTLHFSNPSLGNVQLGLSGTLTVPGGGSGAGTLTGLLKGNGTSPFTPAVAADVVGLFTGCTGTDYLGADGNCYAAGTGTIAGSGTTNAIPIFTGATTLGNSPITLSGSTLTSADRLAIGTITSFPALRTFSSWGTGACPGSGTGFATSPACYGAEVFENFPTDIAGFTTDLWVPMSPAGNFAGAPSTTAILGWNDLDFNGSPAWQGGVVGIASLSGSTGTIANLGGVFGSAFLGKNTGTAQTATLAWGVAGQISNQATSNVQPFGAALYAYAPSVVAAVSHNYGNYIEAQDCGAACPDPWGIYEASAGSKNQFGTSTFIGSVTISGLPTGCLTNTSGLISSTGSSCGAGGSPAFSAITSGTNVTAAMVVGSGSSLTTSGSGSINATTLGGQTFASPGAIGSGTPAAGSFLALLGTSVTDSGLTPGNCVQASTGGLLVTTSGACGTSSGTVTVTGTPASGNLTEFSGGSSITNGDLSGDVSTSGTLATIVAKVNGVSYGTSPSTNTIAVVTGTNTTTYEIAPLLAGGTGATDQRFVDATTFSGADACAKIAAAGVSLNSFPRGGVVDARGFTGTQACASNPFAGVTVPVKFLFAGATWNTTAQWNLCNACIAEGNQWSSTVVVAVTGFSTGGQAILNIGDGTNTFFDTRFIHFQADCGNTAIALCYGFQGNGIDEGAGLSYVRIRNCNAAAAGGCVKVNSAPSTSNYRMESIYILFNSSASTTANGVSVTGTSSQGTWDAVTVIGAGAGTTGHAFACAGSFTGCKIRNFHFESMSDGVYFSSTSWGNVLGATGDPTNNSGAAVLHINTTSTSYGIDYSDLMSVNTTYILKNDVTSESISGTTNSGNVSLAHGSYPSAAIDTLTDSNGNPFIKVSPTASAVDGVTVTNGATGSPATVTISATGSDTNINLNLVSKGSGTVQCNGSSCGSGSGANTALSNLASVAVNLALSPGTDNSIALDDLTHRYTNLWLGGVLGWTNGLGTQDTGLSRDSAGVIDAGNGTAGDTSATIQATGFAGVGSNGGMFGTEGTGNCTAATTRDCLYPDSTLHNWHINSNNVDLGGMVGTTGTQTLTNKTLDGVTPTTMGYVDATSSIQAQLNAKSPTASPTFTGTVTAPTFDATTHFNDASLTASLPVCSDASKNLSSTCTGLIPTTALAANAVTSAKMYSGAGSRSIGWAFGDVATGSALTTSEVGYVTLPHTFATCTISGWHIMADAGTVTIKTARVATGGTALPTIGSNSISTSGVSLASGTLINSTTVTDFTSTTLSAGDTLGFFITTVATAKQITFSLDCDQ